MLSPSLLRPKLTALLRDVLITGCNILVYHINKCFLCAGQCNSNNIYTSMSVYSSSKCKYCLRFHLHVMCSLRVMIVPALWALAFSPDRVRTRMVSNREILNPQRISIMQSVLSRFPLCYSEMIIQPLTCRKRGVRLTCCMVLCYI